MSGDRCPVCRTYYPSGGHPPEFVAPGLLTLHDIGARWGVTNERVRQMADKRPDFPAPQPGGPPRRWALADIEEFEPRRILPLAERKPPGRPRKNR